jgi:hypothetical protein
MPRSVRLVQLRQEIVYVHKLSAIRLGHRLEEHPLLVWRNAKWLTGAVAQNRFSVRSADTCERSYIAGPEHERHAQ